MSIYVVAGVVAGYFIYVLGRHQCVVDPSGNWAGKILISG